MGNVHWNRSAIWPRRVAHGIVGIGVDRAGLAGGAVEPGDVGRRSCPRRRCRGSSDRGRCSRSRRRPPSRTDGRRRSPNMLSAAWLETQAVELSCCAPHTWYGTCVGGGHVVELRGRHSPRSVQVSPPFTETLAPPSLPLIMRFGSSGAIHRSWLSPCGGADGRQGLAAVGRLVEADVQHVDGVLRLRVGVDARVVEGALAKVAVVGDELSRSPPRRRS